MTNRNVLFQRGSTNYRIETFMHRIQKYFNVNKKICIQNEIQRLCRTEAEYAYNLQTQIIPLKVEKDYKADGWLGKYWLSR